MSSARLPLTQALETVQEQCRDSVLREALVHVRSDVNRGLSLTTSMARQEKVFDSLYVQLVRVGEATGQLDAILLRLAGYLEKAAGLRRKVRLAMVYPLLVLFVAFAAVLLLLTVIVPTFADMFADFGARLPGPTLVILNVSRVVTSNALAASCLLLCLVYGLRVFQRSPRGHYLWDGLVLRLPVVGTLARKGLVARFCRTLGTLLSGGVPLADALGILSSAAGNVRVEELIRAMASAVTRGGRLSQPMSRQTVFPGMVVQMIMVGEETARLDEMLLHVAAHYEEEVDTAVEGLTAIVEPVLIVFLGLILGGILVAMYLPMFDLVNVVR